MPHRPDLTGTSLVGDIGLPSFWTPALWAPGFFSFAQTYDFCYNKIVICVVLTVRWPSGKARVCKTLIRGFDSHPHLFFLPKKAYFVVARLGTYLCAIVRASRQYTVPFHFAKLEIFL